MTNPINIELLNRTLSLPPGEKISITFQSYIDMESARTSLFREKGLLAKKNPCYNEIAIMRFSSKEHSRYKLYLTKRPKITEIEILSADGSSRKESLAIDSDLDKICALMEEDGKSQEEILEYRKNYLKGE